ncbi:trimethylamine methyltransferase family protein [Limibacillus halophilus]|uniref:Methyltransferase n=1 Tax=Limibacillus halophilus TaxID=1579333 RepID=A0A839ST72_9PROT|nr:trimethylamine methyltransferase family protein [Limibacillus halophilus]MBB3064910.1 trimethylamine--corrinoid protein Co-methyltransferase [Limibacillus halophilus]
MEQDRDSRRNRRRRGGADGDAGTLERSRARGGFQQLPWRNLANPYSPIEVVSADGLEAIHQTSLEILEEIGMDFLHPEALEILKAAGAEVTPGSERVRFDRGLIETAVGKAPSDFKLHARNPKHDLTFGGNNIAFCEVASAPNVSDISGGRRVGNFKDYCDLLRLGQQLNIIHLFGGYPVEPVDLPPATRHLDAVAAFVTLTDKAFHGYSLGRQRIVDAIEIARIGRGISHDRLLREPSIFTVVNTSSPLRLDGPMIEGLIEMAKLNQPAAITPFTLSGAMAPATIAGALAQQNAEALAAIAFVQLVNPGAPVLYGGFTSNVDMKSGAPAFGTPEYSRAALAGGQLARRYGLPYRSSNVNAANVVDAQAAYESQMSIWAAVMGHGNMMMHGAGWMEGGLTASFEKVILDAEMLQGMAEFLQPIEVNADSLAMEAVREVGPGGHYFGAQHTLARYENAFYSPILSDWRNFQSWEEAGALTATERAHQIYKQLLTEYEPPALDAAIADELEAFIAKRKEEGGAKAD